MVSIQSGTQKASRLRQENAFMPYKMEWPENRLPCVTVIMQFRSKDLTEEDRRDEGADIFVIAAGKLLW